MPVLDRAYFDKPWTLTRDIINHHDGTAASLTGHADFLNEEGGLFFTESGTLKLPHGAFPATRRTRWHFNLSGIEMFFEDGRFFHGFSDTHRAARHLCGNDIYDVTYEFAPDVWTSRWRVTGPQKNYEMTSHYAPFA